MLHTKISRDPANVSRLDRAGSLEKEVPAVASSASALEEAIKRAEAALPEFKRLDPRWTRFKVRSLPLRNASNT